MATGYLSLTLGSLSITLRQFLGEELPRKYIETVKPTTSAAGTFVVYGRFYEERHTWNINAVISPEEAMLLRAIYWEQHRLRRNFQAAEILIIDTIQPFEEHAPKTRAIAPAPFNATQNLPGNTHISYYAQFWAWIDSEPSLQQLGLRHVGASLTLIEGAEKVAP